MNITRDKVISSRKQLIVAIPANSIPKIDAYLEWQLAIGFFT